MESKIGRELDGGSYNSVKERIEALKRLFPEAVNEGMLDYDTLMTLLGDEFDNEHEKYRFEWKGKLNALKLAQKRSTATLRPYKEESVDWDSTKNLYIEGDNLEVLKLLQQGYLRKVKMIYIDPPYNTGNDFVYEDDFADPIGKYRQLTGQALRANPETAGRYHSNWLNMMYPRLKIAKTLLRDDGVIFISIDDNEVHNLRKLCDEVFGEDNFIATIIWQKVYSPKNSAKYFSEDHDYVLVYARSIELWRPRLLPRTEEMTARYINPDDDPRGPWKPGDLSARNYYGEGTYPITTPSGRLIEGPPTGRYWVVSKSKLDAMDADKRIWWGENGDGAPAVKRFLSEVQDGVVPQTLWFYKDVGHTQESKKELLATVAFSNSDDVFETPKPTRLIKRMLQISTSPDGSDIVLDFFSGSATTAHAVMQLNSEDGGKRQYIMVQLPERTQSKDHSTLAEIGKERIRRAGEMIIADWREKQTGQMSLESVEPLPAPDIGFKVFKLDSSNLKQWDDSYISAEAQETLFERMESMLTPAKPGRSDDDILYEIFLKYGIELTEAYAPLDIGGKRFYAVGYNGYLFICLDKELTVEAVEQAVEYAPGTMIFARDSFPDTNAITNVAQVLEKFKIEFRWV